MKEISTKEKEFKDLVHIIRGQQVMLDSDLAQLYGYEIKAFNQQVKRNIKRFPADFKFQLTKEETLFLSRSQNVTSIQMEGVKGGRSYKPYVFTEQGIYMLSAVLKGESAEKQSIYIIREFKKLRHYLAENQSLLNNADLLKLSTTVMQNKEDIQDIKDTMATKSDIDKIMDNFVDDTTIKEITFLDGQKFEAKEAYINIYKQELVDVTLFTANKGKPKLHKTEINNFCDEYPNLFIKQAK